MKLNGNIKYIAFDADDTLWINEPHFYETEKEYCKLLNDFEEDSEIISKKLFATEMQNLDLFGFGAKSFMLSQIENAINISNGNISPRTISKIIDLGKKLIDMDIELLEGVEKVLSEVSKKYTLIVATKGDLLDQERKLKKSGLEKYFDHIEIMSDKKTIDYSALLHRLKIDPANFLMVGNSLKSDIHPVVEIGACAIHIPSEITWEHEKIIESEVEKSSFISVNKIEEVLKYV